MYTWVKNAKGSSDDKPPEGYDSWKDFWEEQTKRKFGKCSNAKCKNDAKVGGHVEKVYNLLDDKLYIVPLCYDCNNQREYFSFYVLSSELVPIKD